MHIHSEKVHKKPYWLPQILERAWCVWNHQPIVLESSNLVNSMKDADCTIIIAEQTTKLVMT